MPRLIDANRIVYSWVIDNDGEEHDGITLQSIIDKMPTVDAKPVRHGHWEIDMRGNWACSLCGNDPYHDNMKNMNYCPNCGARMDEVSE